MAAEEDPIETGVHWDILEGHCDDEHSAPTTKVLSIPRLGVPVSLQEVSRRGIAFSIWSASLLLSNYLAKTYKTLSGFTAVELGAGPGLAGIVAAILGARVVLTDREPVVSFMERNISLNGLSKLAVARALSWGDECSEIIELTGGRPSLILAADVLYLEAEFSPLLKTLVDLCGPNTTILLANETRRASSEAKFLRMASERFVVSHIAIDEDTIQTTEVPKNFILCTMHL
mmetsp:Transcript_35078/g.56745  ORF Transcript_35078/g.56745 Transcript_35078/m.56745 type:complete len:231 (+) Transcript_35078:30-722(+)